MVLDICYQPVEERMNESTDREAWWIWLYKSSTSSWDYPLNFINDLGLIKFYPWLNYYFWLTFKTAGMT